MRIHLIAIGGSIMHNLALALQRAGHIVSGSDDEIYDPARTNLLSEGLLPDPGWNAERIGSNLDVVILGMHAKKDNPELLRTQELGLSVVSFPEFIFAQSQGKERVVVAGSHGKTTTTSMILHVLNKEGTDMDYLVGAQLDDFDLMVNLGDAPVLIAEGDEYLSSPIDRVPKIWHYYPHIAIITGIAWDHMNVFPTFADYKNAFAEFIRRMPSGGHLFYDGSDAILQEIVAQNSDHLNVESYDPYPATIRNGITYLHAAQGEVPLQVFGEHNLKNLSAAHLVLAQLGISKSSFLEHIGSFTGAAKRQQMLHQWDHGVAYQDFAHAPSKVMATVTAFGNQYPDRRLVACLELHTFSSLNTAFLPHYALSLSAADIPIVYISDHTIKMKQRPSISEQEVRSSFEDDRITVFRRPEELAAYITSLNWTNANLLMMSSGTFDGLDLKSLVKGSVV
ncbi:MAG: hypothetical protein KTR24_13010 [Saprospiraceae bacterium]|nr:hypothetical protein [Saprospiraceae bacterium]